MRRAPIVLTATAAGLAAVLSFQPRAPDPATATTAATQGDTSQRTSTPHTSSGSSGTSGSSTGTRTATGDAISTPYGNAQVKVTVTDGRITDVQAVQLQGSDPKSVQISSSAEPVLRESALTKQSGDIDAVSGATITSASYEASLQSALDQLGFQAADGSRGGQA